MHSCSLRLRGESNFILGEDDEHFIKAASSVGKALCLALRPTCQRHRSIRPQAGSYGGL
jgi:hypothetical protein